MKILFKINLIIFLLMLSYRQTKGAAINDDTAIYKQVINSLVQVALVHGQLHPIVIISESKRLKKPESPNEESLKYIVHSYAEDSINYLHNAENYKVLENKQLRNVLLSISEFNRSDIIFSGLKSAAKIRHKSNGWSIFKSYKKAKRYRKNNPEFFCVADITKPVYAGDYAIVVIDRQFGPLGGGGYMHIFKNLEGKWQTYALVNLWHY